MARSPEHLSIAPAPNELAQLQQAYRIFPPGLMESCLDLPYFDPATGDPYEEYFSIRFFYTNLKQFADGSQPLPREMVGTSQLKRLTSAMQLAQHPETALLLTTLMDLADPSVGESLHPHLLTLPYSDASYQHTARCGNMEPKFTYFLHPEIKLRQDRFHLGLHPETGQPLWVEKHGEENDRLCLTLAPVRVGRLLLPPGSVLSHTRPGYELAEGGMPSTQSGRGSMYAIDTSLEYYLQRFSAFAVPQADRDRAFGSFYYEWEDEGAFRSMHGVELAHFQQMAQQEVASD
jgi:hypothetical protein